MAIKDSVLNYLEANKGAPVSGAQIASELGVSRNGVWKAIKSLQQAGYEIEGTPNKGYTLSASCSILSKASIEHYANDPRISVEYHDCIGSTNERAKELAAAGCAEGTVVVADQQTAGKGRQGRAFYSPAGSGVYFSFVLRPTFGLSEVTLVTSYTAYACAKAMDEVFGVNTQIKWVNDIFCNGQKVCGILTEASIQPETATVGYMVVGVGVNVSTPEGGFPEEVGNVAGTLSQTSKGDARAQLVARTMDLFFKDYEHLTESPHLQGYREKSLLTGKTVHAQCGKEEFTATVLGINDDFTLEVRLENGSVRSLAYGEVHIASTQFV